MAISTISVKRILPVVRIFLCLLVFIVTMVLLMNASEIDYQNDSQPKVLLYRMDLKSKRSKSTPVGRNDERSVFPVKRNSHNKLPNFFLHKDKRREFQDAIINFWHIQKTGGSSMEACLKSMYEQLNYPLPFASMSSCVNLKTILDDVTCVTNTTYKPVVYGHYSLGVCDFIHQEITDRKCSVFTIFREPYERAVSHYFFHRQYAYRDPNLCDTLELPINEWVKKFGSIVWTSFLFPEWTVSVDENGEKTCSETFNGRTKWPQNEHLMSDIVNNLDKTLSFIGLFEDQSTTYRMMREIYNLPFHDVCMNIHDKMGSYEGLNVSAQRDLKREAKELLMKDEELKELMKFDVMVYERAKEIFYAQKIEFERMIT